MLDCCHFFLFITVFIFCMIRTHLPSTKYSNLHSRSYAGKEGVSPDCHECWWIDHVDWYNIVIVSTLVSA